jgi:type IV fimbrial biogenesis protein FimT
MKKHSGFTIVELMMALALMAVVMVMAVPNFNRLIKNNRLASQANEFITAVNYARNEAIKRNQNVILCRSSNGTSCGSGTGWEAGWIVYADVNNNASLDSGEELRIFGSLTGGNSLRGNANYANTITYGPKGYVTQAGELILCDDRNSSGNTADAEDFAMGRAIIISATGRPRVTAAAASSFVNCGT